MHGVMAANKLVSQDVNLLATMYGTPDNLDMADGYYNLSTFLTIFPAVYAKLVLEGYNKEAEHMLNVFQQCLCVTFDVLGYDCGVTISLKKREDNPDVV